jgi:hypothetical protein
VLGSAALVGAEARLTTSGLPVGNAPIRAYYAGTATFAGSISLKVIERVVRHHPTMPQASQVEALPSGEAAHVPHRPLLRRHRPTRSVSENGGAGSTKLEP